ncbi:hypothetical protein FOA52_014061 [Chlamydomonas sp. UWO 241]|nr:hypothetical protein FOA52_014061 [Chlamydomonas sp. UWO 241]
MTTGSWPVNSRRFWSPGTERATVPSLTRWGFSSMAAQVLVRIELLWLMGKSYVAVGVMAVAPFCCGAAFAATCALIEVALGQRTLNSLWGGGGDRAAQLARLRALPEWQMAQLQRSSPRSSSGSLVCR